MSSTLNQSRDATITKRSGTTGGTEGSHHSNPNNITIISNAAPPKSVIAMKGGFNTTSAATKSL